MTRAALLPTTGDPYTVNSWIRSYKRYVQKHIDKLYVVINSPVEDRIFNYIVDEFKSLDADIQTERRFTDHGPAITRMIDICKEDHVIILEDDFLIQNANSVNAWFKIVEDGKFDMVGSMRGSCSQELYESMARKYSLTAPEKHQPNFWPCLFVSRLSDLMRTDKNFSAKRWPPNVYIPEADFTPTMEWAGDTFVWMSMQLRHLGLSVHQVNQKRLIDVMSRGEIPPWLHIGSGSSSLNGHLLNEDLTILGRAVKTPHKFPPVPDRGIKQHFESKFAFWAVLNRLFPIPDDHPAAFFNKDYGEAVQRTIDGCSLDRAKIAQHDAVFSRMVTPLL